MSSKREVSRELKEKGCGMGLTSEISRGFSCRYHYSRVQARWGARAAWGGFLCDSGLDSRLICKHSSVMLIAATDWRSGLFVAYQT